jgi:hypothetical protein
MIEYLKIISSERLMANQRLAPYIWVTWLPKLLVGSDQCEWSSWFKAHHDRYDKVPSDFNQSQWQMAHTELLAKLRADMIDAGYKVYTERQNSFSLRGQTGITLGGKPDLIGIRENEGLIVDGKTGQPKDSDPVQVMIYMWAIPLALPKFKNIQFDGRVCYTDHSVEIPASQIDAKFKRRLTQMIKRIGGDEPCRKIPSASECQFCPIAETECPERDSSGTDSDNAGMTDAF